MNPPPFDPLYGVSADYRAKVLALATSGELMERLQAKVPQAKFVKAFNSIGNAFMVKPAFQPTPTMFICGDDDGAKATVTEILTAFGWHTADMGGVQSARPIEALCQLWCVRGMLKNDWPHALRWLDLPT